MNMDHIFIDVTTSSLEAESGEVLSIAAIRTDRTGRHIQAFQSKVKPKNDDFQSTPRKGTEYSAREWEDAPAKREVCRSMHSILVSQYDPKYVVVAHFTDMVRPFVRNMGEDFKGRAWIDTAQLAWPMIGCGQLPSRGLDSLAIHFGVNHEEFGATAVGDCATLMLVYWAMMNRYKGALGGEELLRIAGGDTLASVRKWFRV